MSSKRNQILIGVILLLVGIISLRQDVFDINLGGVLSFILLFVCGFAFLLLYRTKRKNWSLIVGSYLVYIGILTFKIGDFSLSSFLFPSIFFIVPAFIFLVLYYDKNKRGLLLPGMIFLWFGIFIILAGFDFFKPVLGIFFFICMGTAFLASSIIGKEFLGKWVKGVYLICYTLAILRLLNLPYLKLILGYVPQAGSILIILASVIIIIKAIRSK